MALGAALLLAAGAAAGQPVIRPLYLGTTVDPPLKWLEKDVPVGLEIDLLAEILPQIGVKRHEFVFYEGSARVLEEGRRGRIDVIVTLSKNADREQFLIYPKRPHITLHWNFVIRAEDARRITYDNLDDLLPFRVGAAAKLAYTPDFWRSALNIQQVPKEASLLPMLLEKRLDVVPMQSLETAFLAREKGFANRILILPKPLRSADYYHPWSKNSDFPDKEVIMERFDKLIASMQASGALDRRLSNYTDLNR